jgi:hypothetical protein
MKTVKRLFQATVAVSALVLACYGIARAYLAHEVTKAGQMMKDLETIKIGDNEDSAVFMSRKYDGYRRDQETLRRLYEKPDYQYVIPVDPWRFWRWGLDAHPGRLDNMIGAASTTIAPKLRREIGLRRWSVIGIISIRQKQVVAVTTQAIVEGRNEWLGGSWYLYETMPDREIEQLATRPDIPWPQKDRYLVGWRRLDFNKIDGGGESAEAWITPSATPEERQSASQFNLQCFASRSGCQTMCDFVSGETEYARLYSMQAATKSVCSAPRPAPYW